MSGTVNITELFDEMDKRGLIVVHKNELLNNVAYNELQFRREQRGAMLEDALPVLTVARLKLLPRYSTVNGLKKSKLFHPGEMYLNSEGHHMICRSAIIRLRKKMGAKEL